MRYFLTAFSALLLGTAGLPLVLVFAPKGIPALFVLLSVLLLLTAQGRQALSMAWRSPFVLATLPLCTIGLLSTIWALEPDYSLQVALRTFGIALFVPVFFLAADRLDDLQRQRLLLAFCLAGAVMVILLLLGVGEDSPLLKLLRNGPRLNDDDKVRFLPSVAGLASLAWPLALAFKKRLGWPAALLFLCLCLAVFVRNLSFAPQVMFLASAAGGLLIYWLRDKAVWLISASSILLGAFFPFAIRFAFERIADFKDIIYFWPWEIHHRLWIWGFSSEKFLEKPWLGWGMDAARSIPGGRDNLPIPLADGAELLPLHPHDIFMQVWLELGVVGFLALAFLIVFLGRQIASIKDRLNQSVAGAMFVLILGLEAISYGIWQSKWLALIVLAVVYYRLVAGKEMPVNVG